MAVKKSVFKRFLAALNPKWLVYDFVKITAAPLYLIGFPIRIYYEDKASQSRKIKGNALVISNHFSIFDPVTLCMTFYGRRLSAITAETLFEKNKLFAWFLRRLGCVRIDRNTVDVSCINTCLKILNNGGIVSMFPEGMISRTGEVLEFKGGVGIFASQTNAPIIPVYIDSATKMFHIQRIIIGKPMYISDYYVDGKKNFKAIDDLSRGVHDKIIELKAILEEKRAQEMSIKRKGKK
ncbi:MAG: 1-acyl-sn-glycerol-3-phosphate acyltransferase [Clostridiales bacterium]|nr:1-acyl-sn-glycerol-3-phosphate acyltransferase [Clostridiales bacterium]